MKKIIPLILIATLLSSCTYVISEENFFKPHKSGPTAPSPDSGIIKEELSIFTPDGNTLTGYALINPKAKNFLLYFTGVGENANDDTKRVLYLCGANTINAAAFDYRGYGSSTGKAGFESIMADSEAIYEFINKKYKPKKIFTFGHSLGTIPAQHLGIKKKISGVILEAPFTNAKDALASISQGLAWPAREILHFTPDEKLRTLSPQPENKIRDLKCPLLVLHGEKDDNFPPSMGVIMHTNAASRDKKLVVVQGAGHFVPLEKEPASGEIRAFIERLK